MAFLGRAWPQNRRLTESVTYVVQRVQANAAQPANATSGAVAFSSAVRTGSLLVAVVNCEGSGGQRNTSAVSDSVNGAWTKADAALYSESGWLGEVSVWYCANTAAGTPTVTATYGNVATNCLCLAEYAGLPPAAVVDATAIKNTDTGTAHATANATTTVADLLVGAFGDWGSNCTYSATGWTKATSREGSASIQGVLFDQGVGTPGMSAGTYAAAATSSVSNSPADVFVAFQAVAPPAPTVYTKTGGAGGQVSASGAKQVQASIVPVGSLAYSSGTGGTTLAVTPQNVGDAFVLGVAIGTTGVTVSAVSGGGCTGWQRLAGPYAGTAFTRSFELWVGTVATTGASTITITPSGSVAGARVDRGAQEFRNPYGAAGSWARDGAYATRSGTSSSTTIAFPTLAPTAADELYFCYGATTNNPSGPSAGYTLVSDGNSNPWIYRVLSGISASQSPTATQTSGVYDSIGVLLAATPAATGIAVRSRAQGSATADTLAHAITLPAGIVAGDLLYVAFSVDTATTVVSTASTGWAILASVPQGSTTNHTGVVLWKRATGSDALQVDTSTAEQSTHISIAVQNGATPEQTNANGGSAAITSPAPITPSNGTNDYLVILSTHTDSSAPIASETFGLSTGFGNAITQNPTTAQSAATNTQEQLYTGVASIAPDGVSLGTAEQWVSITTSVGLLGAPRGGVTYTKTGGSAVQSATGGAETVQNPVTSSKAGTAAAAGAPGGAKTVVRVAVLITAYKVEVNAANTATLTTPSFTPAAGELLVVKAGDGDVRQLFAVNPTDTQDGEWTRQQSFFSGTNQSAAQVNTARVRTATSMTVSLTVTGLNFYHSMIVERWANAGLAGTPSVAVPTTGSGAPSATVTTVGTESAITWVNADWVPVDPASRVYRSGAQETGLQYTAGTIAVYYAWQRASVNGAQTIGLSAPAGQTWSMVAVELLSKVSTAPTATAPADVTGWALNTQLSISGTDSDPDIDTRRWSIVSGPVGAGTTLGRVKALTWTPSTAGDYVLRYEASNPAGTGSDDIAVNVVTVYAKTGTAVPVGAPGGAKVLTPATIYTKAGTAVPVGAPGGAKVRTTATTYTKAGAGVPVGAPGGAKVRTTAATYTKAGTGALAGAPGGARTTEHAKAGVSALAGAPGGAKAVTSAAVVTKAGAGALAGAPGGAKAVTSAAVYTKAGTSAAVAAPGGGKVVQSGNAIVKSGAGVAVASGGGARTVEHAKTGAGVPVGAPGGAKAVTHPKAGTSAAVGAPGAVKAVEHPKAGTSAAVAAAGGARIIQHGKTGTSAAAAAPGGAETMIRPRTGTAALAGALSGGKSLQSGNAISKSGGAAAAGAPGGAKTVTHPVTSAKAGTAAAVGAPGGGKAVQTAGAIVKAGTAAAVGAPGGGKAVQSAVVYAKAGASALAGAPGGGKSIAGAGFIQKAGTAAGQGAPGGAKSTGHQKTGTSAPVGAPGGAKSVAGPGAIVKSGGAAIVAAPGGAQSTVHAATIAKAGTAAVVGAPGGAKTRQSATTYTKAGTAAGQGAPGGTKLTQAAGAIVKTGTAAGQAAPGGGRVRVLGRTGTAAVMTAPGGSETVQAAGAIVKTGTGVAIAAPGGARIHIHVKAGGSAAAGAPGGARAGTINKAGTAAAVAAPAGAKVFAPHVVSVKAGAGVASVVSAGARIRVSQRLGGAAGNLVSSGSAYVNPRRKTGTAAARAAPGGELLIHEFIQFGHVHMWQQAAPGALVMAAAAPTAIGGVGPVPVARASASVPGPGAAVGETDRVPGAVWWDGVSE